ncbi:MAG TPA: protein-L-isoaspartate(D-aspartate) O-methyltransferase [Chloroflexia bacterium]|nr:protein-L-isoaspartate(D-aspartate) O-methyltransferase [Chloroflexia bacterium]
MGGNRDARRERELRELMVERQIRARGLEDPAVLQAMRTVPREAFVPEELRDRAYIDAALPIPDGQTISQPYIVALMATTLQLKPGDRVLEIGTGSGYAAAVLSRIAQEVYTVERHESLALAAKERLEALGYDNVRVGVGDGTLGWAEHAPYDAITVAASGPQVPDTLRAQLKIGGRLVMPMGSSRIEQKLVRVTRESEDEYAEENLVSVSFVPLIGREGWEDGG